MRADRKAQERRKSEAKPSGRKNSKPTKRGPKLSDVVSPGPWSAAKKKARKADAAKAEEDAEIVSAVRKLARKSLRSTYRGRFGKDIDLARLVSKALCRYDYELRLEMRLGRNLESAMIRDLSK